jgi:hypothetical protein
MAHNFRIIGASRFLSKGAVAIDTNDGLTGDSPKASLSAFFSLFNTSTVYTGAIGAGTYEDLPNAALASSSNIYADGEVVFRGNGANTFTLTRSAAIAAVLNGIRFENYAGFNFNHSATNCLFKDINGFTGLQSTQTFTNCIFINCVFTASGNGNFIGCIFINCTVSACTKLQNSYVDGTSTFTLPGTGGPNYFNNNFMGLVRYTSGSPFMNLASFQAQYTGYFSNSFNAPPLFNNVQKYDFTLQPGSPHFNAASDGLTTIGGTSYGKGTYFATAPEWSINGGAIYSMNNGVDTTTDPSLADILLSGGDFVLAPGKTKGYVRSAPIKVFDSPQTVTKLQYNGLPLFNKAVAGGTPTNQNVPDANVNKSNTTVAGGNNPDRLAIRFRCASRDDGSAPVLETDWDNSGANNTGAFMYQEINQQPFFDSNGNGTGNTAFNQAAYAAGTSPVKNAMSFNYAQIELWLSDDYIN